LPFIAAVFKLFVPDILESKGMPKGRMQLNPID